jgi:hypothetical protein
MDDAQADAAPAEFAELQLQLAVAAASLTVCCSCGALIRDQPIYLQHEHDASTRSTSTKNTRSICFLRGRVAQDALQGVISTTAAREQLEQHADFSAAMGNQTWPRRRTRWRCSAERLMDRVAQSRFVLLTTHEARQNIN